MASMSDCVLQMDFSSDSLGKKTSTYFSNSEKSKSHFSNGSHCGSSEVVSPRDLARLKISTMSRFTSGWRNTDEICKWRCVFKRSSVKSLPSRNDIAPG